MILSAIRTMGHSIARQTKNIVTLRSSAVSRLKTLYSEYNANSDHASSQPKFLKIGVKKKGCSGSSYTLDFSSEKGKFDEVVEQDGIKVIIDSKALLSIVGSEIDYVEDHLSSQFVFINPNVKETCGCGESFMT